MKNRSIHTLSLILLLAVLPGCSKPDDKQAKLREKAAKPTFMFWCFRKEIQTDEFHVPDLNNPKAAQYINARLKQIPGLTDVTVNMADRMIEVEYKSSMIRKMNIEEAIALAGFSVNGRPASPKAKLPQGVK